MQSQWLMKSKIGSLYLVASDQGLQGIYWKKQKVKLTKSKIIVQAMSELEEYFLGKRRVFDLPLDLIGTPFQKSVWKQLQKIPYGKTLSYKEIARKIRNPKAVRAVGTANARNPLCVIVPCHRVISADGSLGGYSGGVKKKKTLLNLEQGL